MLVGWGRWVLFWFCRRCRSLGGLETLLVCCHWRVVGDLDSAEVLADLGDLALLHKEFLDDTVKRTGDLNAGLVTLNLAERVEGVNGGGRLNVPAGARGSSHGLTVDAHHTVRQRTI